MTADVLSEPSDDERTFAMLAHISAFYLGILISLVVTLVIFIAKRKSKFVAFHAIQSIFWQCIVLTVVVLVFLVDFRYFTDFIGYYFLETVIAFSMFFLTALVWSGVI